ncbi:MAG TPA: methylmalonyl-CoA epimerase [Sphingobacteriaceae bacterium]|nr:methylmalonyl-CoA epimerase [Sphingobacteriaceae bacterium]
MDKIEHIGIAVKNLEESILRYEILLQTSCYKRETVLSEHVETAFFKVGESKIELLEAIDNQGAIASFIEKRGEGIHHIAYEVEDIKKEMVRLAEDGFRLLNEVPKKGADNKWVCFVHPKDASGVLTELVETINK